MLPLLHTVSYFVGQKILKALDEEVLLLNFTELQLFCACFQKLIFGMWEDCSPSQSSLGFLHYCWRQNVMFSFDEIAHEEAAVHDFLCCMRSLGIILCSDVKIFWGHWEEWKDWW